MVGGADLRPVGATLRWRAAVAERQGGLVHPGENLAPPKVALGGLATSACCMRLRRPAASRLWQPRRWWSGVAASPWASASAGASSMARGGLGRPGHMHRRPRHRWPRATMTKRGWGGAQRVQRLTTKAMAVAARPETTHSALRAPAVEGERPWRRHLCCTRERARGGEGGCGAE